jgi:UDP-N-acetylmuramoyl-L-alanyl-D-glutamate--2,6-diaminopimelate ligase
MNRSNSRGIELEHLQASLPEGLAIRSGAHQDKGRIISGLSFDSRRVVHGDLFFALTGGENDGHAYIQEAIHKGASAVVGERVLERLPVPYIQVTSSRMALAHLAAAFYGHPAKRLTVIGVTGTDGKTTTANLIFQILQAAGLRVGLISTVNAVIGEEIIDTGFHVTTPEATDIQYYLSMMVAESLTHVVLEATSHGLAQHRVAACDFDIGVVTNITHEHLDYHISYPAYRRAKASIFDILASKGPKNFIDSRYAVLNRDDESYGYLDEYVRQPHLQARGEIDIANYGIQKPADVYAKDIAVTRDGVEFTAVGVDFQIPVRSWLRGGYNVPNCLAAIASTVMALGINPEFAAKGIENLRYLPGRMERIDLGTEFLTIVDFAHTPNALRESLLSLRQMLNDENSPGRVIAVFGSAGLRDRAKRRMMAEISAELADITILTAEDPRTESLDEILDEMSSGCRTKDGIEGTTFWRIRDRGEAIRFAVRLAHDGDAVVILGKGHEQSMCFGETEYEWDDRTALSAAISQQMGITGPEMPYLPTQDEA